MSFFGFGAPTGNWKIGKFGDYQKTFDEYFQHPYEPKSRFFNRYFIFGLQVSRESLEDGTKFYKIVFHSHPKEHEFDMVKFIVTIENRGDPNNSLMKSTTLLSMETPNAHCRIQEHHDILNYSSMCEKWLIDALFYKNYEIDTLFLVSPPKFYVPTRAYFHVNRVEIRADKNERDMLYAYYWLNFFRKRQYSKGPFTFKIISPFIEMKIAGNQRLTEIARIELNGKFDITAESPTSAIVFFV